MAFTTGESSAARHVEGDGRRVKRARAPAIEGERTRFRSSTSSWRRSVLARAAMRDHARIRHQASGAPGIRATIPSPSLRSPPLAKSKTAQTGT